MTNHEIDPSLVDPMTSTVHAGAAGAEVPDQVYEIGAQIGGIILSLQEAGNLTAEHPFRYGVTPLDMDGEQSLVLQSDGYPGRGVIAPVSRASVTRLDNGLWRYSRYTEMSHSGAGARSNEGIDATSDVSMWVFSKPGYSSRPMPKPRKYNWSTGDDRPFISQSLDRFSQSLDNWHKAVLKREAVTARKWEHPLPRQFRNNVLPFEQRERQ